MIVKYILISLLLVSMGLFCNTPVHAGESGGLLSGNLDTVSFRAFIGDVPENPEFLTEKEAVVRTRPDDALAWIDIGKFHLKNKNWRDAKMAFEVAIELDRTNLDSWEGYCHVCQKDALNCGLLSEMPAVIKNNPDWTFGYWYNLVNLRKAGNYEEALRVYEQLIQLDPLYRDDTWFADTKSVLEFTLTQEEKYDEVIKDYDIQLQSDPHNIDLLTKKGDLLRKQKKYEDAIKAYDEAILLKPDDLGLWRSKGFALRDLGRVEEAIVVFEKAHSWSVVGDLQSNLKRYEEALQSYDKILQNETKNGILTDNAWTWLGKGNALNNLKRYDEALEAYEKAEQGTYWIYDSNDLYQTDPDALAWAGKGDVLSGLKRYEEALAACEKAIKINPELAGGWNGKGNALKNLTQYDLAMDAYEKAISLGSEEALVNKKDLLDKMRTSS
jgi:tetratricopeptide (TPR) repeat protein